MAVKLVKKTEEQENSQILKGLNPEQYKAVTTIDGPLLVVAGAGSGKTRVLTHRIAYMLQHGISPSNILSLTFTNKAAGEMKARIAKIVSPEAANRVWAGTFHSVFARILRREAEQLGYTKSFSIYDTDESMSALKHVMNTMGISQQQYPPQAIRSRISSAKNQMIDSKAYASSADNTLSKQTAIIYEAYEKQLRENNAMDFDDLLLNMINVLRKSTDTLKHYQNLFKYILVDEYQDTNRAQYIVINMLASAHHNICVVGDDAQSIYRWRGADIRNILDFQKDYPEAVVIRLEQNYRSTKNILAAADCVIKRNHKQIQKNLWTENHEGELIDIVECSDDREESARIVDTIKTYLKKSEYTPQDFAILYRTNAQSLALENSLRKENIPYVIVGGISFYKRKEVKDVLAYLKLLLNPKDSESLLRIVNEPPRGLGQTSLKHFRHYADVRSISVFEAFEKADEIDELQTRAKQSAKNFVQFVKNYTALLNQLKPGELAVQYIESTGMLQMYKEINTEDANDRWNNIQQLLSDVDGYFAREKEAKMEDYLQEITLLSDIDEKDTSQNQIKLMTLHSAKGLEFPVVFIAGMEHGLFPLVKAEMHPEEEEEERRLFYVGITRAESKLYLTYSKRRLRFGEVHEQTPSAFLREIDTQFTNWSGRRHLFENTISQHPKTQSYKPKSDRIVFDDIPRHENYSQVPPPQHKGGDNLKTGDRVRHSTFGLGRIEMITGVGSSRQAMVNFVTVGRKKLMLQYAKLEKA